MGHLILVFMVRIRNKKCGPVCVDVGGADGFQTASRGKCGKDLNQRPTSNQARLSDREKTSLQVQ